MIPRQRTAARVAIVMSITFGGHAFAQDSARQGHIPEDIAEQTVQAFNALCIETAPTFSQIAEVAKRGGYHDSTRIQEIPSWTRLDFAVSVDVDLREHSCSVMSRAKPDDVDDLLLTFIRQDIDASAEILDASATISDRIEESLKMHKLLYEDYTPIEFHLRGIGYLAEVQGNALKGMQGDSLYMTINLSRLDGRIPLR